MQHDEARTIYQEIVEEVRERGALAGEQQGELPVATIHNGHELGEVKMIRQPEEGYRVVWYPPEAHIGQDIATQETVDEADTVDVSKTPPGDAVERILAYETQETRLL